MPRVSLLSLTMEALKKTFLLLSLIGSILILLFSTIGCGDTPYTGQILSPGDIVDQYLVSGEDSICLVNGVESFCLKLTHRGSGGTDSGGPIIHIHPRKLIYMFFYEGKQIVHAEKVMDTTEIVEAVTESVQDPVQPPIVNPSPILVTNPPPNRNTLPVQNTPPNNAGGNNGGNNNRGNNGGNNGGGNQQPVTPPRTPTTLERSSGNSQSGETDQHLTNPLVVKVLDQDSDALSGVTVSLTVSPSDGVLSPASTTTGSNGEASTALQLGGTAGTYTVTASASGIAQSVTFTATATVRPTDSDWAQQSHYYDAEESKHGWLVWIYYPENYEGPMQTTDGDADFQSNGFMLIPSTGATITEFSQTEGPCYDADKPCHIATAGDWENSTAYSVQIFLATTQDQASIQVIWDRKAANWSDGSPPPDMTYNLMASKNLMSGQEGDDPDHTNQ